jgi:hypothetical protein
MANDRLHYLLARLALSALALLAPAAGLTAEEPANAAAERQSLDDAWWTGPILAASASTLPQGHFLVEPYLFDVISQGRYDENGDRHGAAADNHTLGSLTYLLYGLVDSVSVGLIPRFGFNDLGIGKDSSGVLVGDLTLQAQYRLTQFREGSPIPTISLVLQETLPTGKHDRLGDRPADGFGSGAYSTTLAGYFQHYFWMPNGRILRARLNASQTWSGDASVVDVSVYGTEAGFRGHAEPGDSFTINVAGEYSLTRNWVLALDVVYQHDANTRVVGRQFETDVVENSGSGWLLGVAPAIEYNLSSRVGVIFGARWFPAGSNANASITPVVAINMVY